LSGGRSIEPATGQKNPGQQRHQKRNTTAKAPRDSMEYKALVPLRDKAADYHSFVIEGSAN
jgi:uncharacterized protein (DUF1330 family)